MKTVVRILLVCIGSVTVNAPSSTAQELEVRQFTGGLIRLQSATGLDLIIRPNEKTALPEGLQSVQSVVLGSEFDPMALQWNGQPLGTPLPKNGQAVPGNALSVDSVLIGKKRAGVQIRAKDLNVLVASVDLMSEQGFISMRETPDMHLLVLTFTDAQKLHTGRTNLWLGSIESQQIALNPTTSLPSAAMEKFYQSLKRNRTLPTAVLPMIQVPNRNLKFGDRQVVLLKELK